LGICVEVIWNYIPLFFIILKAYNLYSNFICISSILNTRLENLIAGFIIVGGCLVSQLALICYNSAAFGGGGLNILSKSVEDISQKLTQTKDMY
jgi:hypothetical protein